MRAKNVCVGLQKLRQLFMGDYDICVHSLNEKTPVWYTLTWHNTALAHTLWQGHGGCGRCERVGASLG